MAEKTPQHGERSPEEAEEPPEDRPDEPGAEGGCESAEDAKTPFWPSKKDRSALGDTDQHSEE